MTDINRIRKLAGLPQEAPQVLNESAEVNDHGTDPKVRGGVYAGATSRPGTARAPTRYVPTGSGDNALAEEDKEQLEELDYHKSEKDGDLRAKQHGSDFKIERFKDEQYGSFWDLPDWAKEQPELAGPFSSKEDALKAISAVSEDELEESYYGENRIALLPAYENNTLDGLENNQYFGDSLKAGDGEHTIYVIGKQNAKGDFTPRYCSSYGGKHSSLKPGDSCVIVHDQTMGKTPGKVLYVFDSDEYMNDRDRVAADLEGLGIKRTKKVPVKVFK